MRRIQFAGSNPVAELQAHIRQHRFLDSGVEIRDLYFKVFVLQHVLTEGPCSLRDLIKELRVYVRPDPERENTCVATLLYIRHDFIRITRPNGGQSISQENNNERARAFLHARLQCGLQGISNGGAANRFQISNEIRRALSMFGISLTQFAEKRFRLGRKSDNLEAIVCLQILNAELQRLFRLLQFAARHRPRGIDDEDDVFGSRLGFFRNCRRGQKQEVTIFSARFVCDQAQTDIAFFGAINELEICIRFLVLGFVTNDRAIGSVSFNFNLVARRINRSERLLRFYFDLHAQAPNRLRGKLLRAQRIAVSQRPGIGAQQFGVGNFDWLATAWFDWKYADLK